VACNLRWHPVVQLYQIGVDEVEAAELSLYLKRKRLVILAEAESEKPHLNLVVLDATMPFAGWVRFTLESGAKDLEEPTICYRPTPYGFELQDEIYGVEET